MTQLEVSLIKFGDFSILKLLFEEVTPPEESAGLNDEEFRSDVRLGLNLRPDEKWGQVFLTLELHPLRKERPCHVEVAAVGLFTMAEGKFNLEQFEKFCIRQAPVIMWPYVREAAYRASFDARFGPVVVPLLNLQPVLLGWEREHAAKKDAGAAARKSAGGAAAPPASPQQG
jgi:preprotein translocase subunit SecB